MSDDRLDVGGSGVHGGSTDDGTPIPNRAGLSAERLAEIERCASEYGSCSECNGWEHVDELLAEVKRLQEAGWAAVAALLGDADRDNVAARLSAALSCREYPEDNADNEDDGDPGPLCGLCGMRRPVPGHTACGDCA